MSQSQNVSVSFGIFKPEEGCGINDAIAHMIEVADVIVKSSDINVAIFKCLDHSWAAVFSASRGQGSDKSSEINLPQAASFTRGLKCPVRMVESGWFHQTCQQTKKGIPFAQLSLGDTVNVRRIYCNSWKTQDVLSYSCLAILRSYFNGIKGILSCSFYDSMDGKQIIGIGVWDSTESALFLEKHPEANPALPYWEQLGAVKLRYDVCEVLHITPIIPIQNSSMPGFQI